MIVLDVALSSGAYGQPKISGIYVAHDEASAIMLQLIQGSNGQVLGTASIVALKKNGKIDSSQKNISGIYDSGQITLSFGGEFFGLFASRLAGTVEGDLITLQTLDDSGKSDSSVFSRSSAREFNDYANRLRVRGTGISTNAALVKNVEGAHAAIRESEIWKQNAQREIESLSAANDRYERIQSKMQILLQNAASVDSFHRSNESFAMYDQYIAGSNLDIHLNSVWQQIWTDSIELSKYFGELRKNCSVPTLQLTSAGATEDLIRRTHIACEEVTNTQKQFEIRRKDFFDKISEEQQFQKEARIKRQALLGQIRKLN